MTPLHRFSRVFAAAMMIAALAPSGAQDRREKVIISILKGPSGIGSAWMMAEPPHAGEATVEFELAAGADLITAKLVSGEIDGGVLPVNVAAKLFNAGVPLRAFAVVGGGMVKFLSLDPSVARLSDVKGKEIYIAGQKATPDYLFQYLADREGLRAGLDYNPRYNLAYPEMAAQLAAGKISNAVLPEPFATQALMLNKDIRVPFDLDAVWTEKTGQASYPMSLFVLSQKLGEKHPQLLAALAQAYAASIARTIAEPEATGKLAETLNLGMKASVAQAAIPKSAYTYIDAKAAQKDIETLLKIFLAFDPQSLNGKLPESRFYGF